MVQSKASKVSWFRAGRRGSGVIPKVNGGWPSASGASVAAPAPLGFCTPLSGYVGLLTLASEGRAQVWVGVAEAERTLERPVIIKRFVADEHSAAWSALGRELELASALDHPNIIRTLRVEGLGSGASRYAVTEYLEGATLHDLLVWTEARGHALPAAAVRWVLSSLLDAVGHGQRAAPAPVSRRLCERPIAAGDVFVTYDGRVKVLGFKPARGSAGAGTEPAVDALLSRHCAPDLMRLLVRGMCGSWDGDLSLLSRLASSQSPPSEALSDGRVELVRAMAGVHPVARARLAGRLVAAFARWRAEHGSGVSTGSPLRAVSPLGTAQ